MWGGGGGGGGGGKVGEERRGESRALLPSPAPARREILRFVTRDWLALAAPRPLDGCD